MPKYWPFQTRYRMRLQLRGKRHEDLFRIVLAQAPWKRDGKHCDLIGYIAHKYHTRDDRLENKYRVTLKVDTVKEYIAKGFKPNRLLASVLGYAGILPLRPKPGANVYVPATLPPEVAAAALEEEQELLRRIDEHRIQRESDRVAQGHGNPKLHQLLSDVFASKAAGENAPTTEAKRSSVTERDTAMTKPPNPPETPP